MKTMTSHHVNHTLIVKELCLAFKSTKIQILIIEHISYKANDIFLKSCSGNPVKNNVEQPPFNCPLAVVTVTVGFDCCNCVIPVVPCIG